jgi:hypothetical protein
MFARSFARRLALLGFQSWVLVLLSDNAAKKKNPPFADSPPFGAESFFAISPRESVRKSFQHEAPSNIWTLDMDR